jgi:hypothetical protein
MTLAIALRQTLYDMTGDSDLQTGTSGSGFADMPGCDVRNQISESIHVDDGSD